MSSRDLQDQMRTARELQAERTPIRAPRPRQNKVRRESRGGWKSMPSTRNNASNLAIRGRRDSRQVSSSFGTHAINPATRGRGSFTLSSSSSRANHPTFNAIAGEGGLDTSIWTESTDTDYVPSYLNGLNSTIPTRSNGDHMDLDKPNPTRDSMGPSAVPLPISNPVGEHPIVQYSIVENPAAEKPVVERHILDDNTRLPRGLQVALVPSNAQMETDILKKYGGLQTSKWASD